MVLHEDLERMAAAQRTDPLGAAGAARELVFLHPGSSISDAANLLLTNDMLQAPVVSADEDFRLLGIITLNDIARQQNARDNA
jgi:CIC family chloride channel protein